ncbi:MAG: polymer-forming cytoskeletal protein [Pseudomonadota bacterium]
MTPIKRPTPPVRPADNTRRGLEIPGMTRPRDVATAPASDGKHLIVGAEISLNGEIKACERLIVEGTVEAALIGSQTLEISQGGLFKGPADVQDAEIDGRFDGELTVHGRLLIRANGLVTGRVRYGQIEIELGGEIAGDVQSVDRPEEVRALPDASAPGSDDQAASSAG